jgi:hypothetical protein
MIHHHGGGSGKLGSGEVGRESTLTPSRQLQRTHGNSQERERAWLGRGDLRFEGPVRAVGWIEAGMPSDR